MARKISKSDTRLKRSTGESRRDRSEDDEVRYQDRALSDEERINEFRMEQFQSILPDLPKIKGYHPIWLSTTNNQDTIARRVQLGYEPIMAKDIPGMEYASVKTGSYVGMIGVNEMVAFKLPLVLYEAYMKIAHHEKPLQEEGKLNSMEKVIAEASAAASSGRKGIKVEMEDGMEELGEDRPLPNRAFSRAAGDIR